MSVVLIFKILIILIFLVMFMRRPSLAWGVGLLTVTTAVLLDTILGTFDRPALLAQLGFFFYAIGGALVGGGAFWMLSLLWPYLPHTSPAAEITAASQEAPTAVTNPVVPPANGQPEALPEPLPMVDVVDDPDEAAYDLAALQQDVWERFGREDVLDLMFDLEIPETAVMPINQNLRALAHDIVVYAAQNGQRAQLALAIERILTPPPPEMLPRLEKMTPASPRASLRYYLLAHYNLEKLQKLSARLGIDWEQLEGAEKRGKVRELLQYLYRRNRIDELLDLMQAEVGETTVDAVEAADAAE